jgi:ribonuclease D
VNQFGVHCEKVYDTQIAHRFWKKGSEDPKDQNISLNSLLQSYLGVENGQKDSMVGNMKVDPDLWWRVSET